MKKIIHITLAGMLLAGCSYIPGWSPAADSRFNETAKFLAGKTLPESSGIYALTHNDYYQRYKKTIDSQWNNFQEKNLAGIMQWQEKNITEKYSDTVFYPFSGPDILNAIAFYPHHSRYIMLGLEPPGSIPYPRYLTERELKSALGGIIDSLGSVLKWNFFRTNDMVKNIGNNYFNGITGIIMFFLSRMDCDIIEARSIWIDAEGDISSYFQNIDPDIAISGTEITFVRPGERKRRTVQYFQLDVRNIKIQHYTNFLLFLKKQERFSTLLKAASYLLHYDHSFTIMRSMVLSRSDFLIQDDSGIPLRHFDRKIWNITYYGSYQKPIPLFDVFAQQDLFEAVRTGSQGSLPFNYGYYIYPGTSHVMVAAVRDR